MPPAVTAWCSRIAAITSSAFLRERLIVLPDLVQVVVVGDIVGDGVLGDDSRAIRSRRSVIVGPPLRSAAGSSLRSSSGVTSPSPRHEEDAETTRVAGRTRCPPLAQRSPFTSARNAPALARAVEGDEVIKVSRQLQLCRRGWATGISGRARPSTRPRLRPHSSSALPHGHSQSHWRHE